MSRVMTRSLRWRCLRGVTAVFVAYALVAGGSALAATPAPGWAVRSVAEPTEFSAADDVVCETDPTGTPSTEGNHSSPCDEYRIMVTNAGSEPSAGTVTISDALPSDMTARYVDGEAQQPGSSAEPIACTTSPVRCTYGRAVQPGGNLIVTINVTVIPTTETTTSNAITVEGGGAATVSSTEPVVLNAPAPVFGINDFAATAVGPGGAVDTQAGDHPSAFTTSFNLNNIPHLASAKDKYTHRSVQDLREIVVDLPPGFVGDPQTAAQCPLSELDINNGVTEGQRGRPHHLP
jgi:hypothetical protein